MTMADAFLDSNILVYAFSTDPRSAKAEELLAGGCITGVQGLNEFTNVARRKLGMSWEETRQALAAIRALCSRIRPVDTETHDIALNLAERHALAVFDALIVAAALQSGCGVLFSEDMHHGMMINGTLRITDPFRES